MLETGELHVCSWCAPRAFTLDERPGRTPGLPSGAIRRDADFDLRVVRTRCVAPALDCFEDHLVLGKAGGDDCAHPDLGRRIEPVVARDDPPVVMRARPEEADIGRS
ncbi:MAG: hypothetical protein HY749_05210 [Gammaproteobacteria bacterium]|nr:hypothetical protein [Gammaproteobacteria bacterium]